MMRLYVLGSGSRGNCCAVEAEGVADPARRGLQRARDRAPRGPVPGSISPGVAGDRADPRARRPRPRRAPAGAAGWVCPCSRRPGPGIGSQARHGQRRPTGPSASAPAVELGPFRVEACPTSHDAADPVALAVRAPDGTSVGVAYDLGRPTAAVRYLLRNLTAIVLEANHDEVQLRTSGYPPVVQRRIAGSGGHLSNRAAAELLAELHHPGLAVVVLAHLSQRCNTRGRRARRGRAGAPAGGVRGDAARGVRRTRRCRAIDVVMPGKVQLRLAL